jgi:uncharacterized membrane protein YbhN (UPF0104 family)
MPSFLARLRRSKILPPALGLAVLAAILFGLHRALEKVSVHQVLAAISATPRPQLLHAACLTAASLCIMCAYDIPGLLFARRLTGFPHLGARRIALASGCAYALSHVLGVAALTAAAVRLRFYAQWAVPPAGIARIITLSGVMFTLGAASLLGGILVLHPADVPLFGTLPPLTLRGLGGLLWLLPALYIAAAGTDHKLVIAGRAIPRPGPVLAVAQIALSCVDTGCAAAILYTVLPTMPGLSYAHVLGIYLAAFAGGLVSALPGGVGVFDSLLLLGLACYMGAAQALAAILLFRLLYYIMPAVLAGAAFCGHEIWLSVKRRHLDEKSASTAKQTKY